MEGSQKDDLKTVEELIGVVIVLLIPAGFIYANRYRLEALGRQVEAWFGAHWWQLALIGGLIALLIGAIPALVAYRHLHHHRVSKAIQDVQVKSAKQKELSKALGWEADTRVTRELQTARDGLARLLKQKPPPSDADLGPLPAEIEWMRPEIHSCMDDFTLGGYRGGRPMKINLTPEPGHQLHMLIAGQSGNGKTTTLNLFLSNYAYCRDAILAGIDVGGGGFHRWRTVFQPGWYVEDHDEVIPLLYQITEEMTRREAILKDKQKRGKEGLWDPHSDGPDLFLLIDEGADLMPISIWDEGHKTKTTAYDILLTLVLKGRKNGIHIIYCTQRPTADIIPTTLRSQLQVTLGLRVRDLTDSEVIFGRRVEAHKIPDRGVGILQIPTADTTDDYGRIIQMTEDQVRTAIEDRSPATQPPAATAPAPATATAPNVEGNEIPKPPVPPPAYAVDTTPPEGLTKGALKSWCRGVTWQLIRLPQEHPQKVRDRPELCEGDACSTKLNQHRSRGDVPHHWDYHDPRHIAWLCRPCHEKADLERETQGVWSEGQARETLDLHAAGRTWNQLGEPYGITGVAMRQRCLKQFPHDPEFRTNRKSG